jgi:hypothetical protein
LRVSFAPFVSTQSTYVAGAATARAGSKTVTQARAIQSKAKCGAPRMRPIAELAKRFRFDLDLDLDLGGAAPPVPTA